MSMKKLFLGLSACLAGENVRYDGANKRSDFIMDRLLPYIEPELVCPEVAIGLGIPRKPVHLVKEAQEITIRFTNDAGSDLTPEMNDFAKQKISSLHHLCGYVVCAKSPSCGMVDTKIFQPSGELECLDAGIYTKHLLKLMPWLPVEDNNRLSDPAIRDHFLVRIFALHELNQLNEEGLSKGKLIAFHSHYKYMLLAHSQSGYRALGKFMADIAQWDSLVDFFKSYRQQFMDILSCKATRENHVNTLMHIQGYFKKRLTSSEKIHLIEVISGYQSGKLSLMVPLNLLKEYLTKYPDAYLAEQRYFEPYPAELQTELG